MGIVCSLEVLARVISCSPGELSQAAWQEESVPRGKSQDNFQCDVCRLST